MSATNFFLEHCLIQTGEVVWRLWFSCSCSMPWSVMSGACLIQTFFLNTSPITFHFVCKLLSVDVPIRPTAVSVSGICSPADGKGENVRRRVLGFFMQSFVVDDTPRISARVSALLSIQAHPDLGRVNHFVFQWNPGDRRKRNSEIFFPGTERKRKISPKFGEISPKFQTLDSCDQH